MSKVRSVTVLRWVARIWSIASIGLLCAFLFGEGLPPFTIKAVLFPFGVMLGLILAWWLELIGGFMAAVSMLLFYVLEHLGHGRFPKGYAFILVSAPSVIFICCGFFRARQMNGRTAEPKPEGDGLRPAPEADRSMKGIG
jgi:hypothetical protein